ncbi:MAG: metallophosphoesterase [Byssovorax sp.]
MPDLPEINYLFRYRDLVAETLKEHQEIIGAHRSCLWGWWKRPHEDARMEVWDALQTRLSAGGPFLVGLFDSGEGRVHLAMLTGVIPPKLDRLGTCEQLPPPTDQDTLVPAYYRQSPFSRAWLRLSEIDSKDFPFFEANRYVYTKAPPLRGFEEESLGHHLIGKIISDANELRGMDTTIWEVAPAQEGARAGRVFTITAHIQPVSRQPIPLDSCSILHITDPHFAVDPHRDKHAWRLDSEKTAGSSLADAIYQVTRNSSVNIGAVVITGDLTFTGADEEFDVAFKSLSALLGKYDLGPQHLVIVPGNHDIRWTTNATYDETSPVTVAPEAARQGYANFYKKMFRTLPDNDLCMARRFVLPNGAVIELVGLNSSTLETGKHFLAGMGRIDENTFVRAATELQWDPKKPSRALRLLALHHHLLPTDNIEPADGYIKGFGMVVDGPRIQRLAANHGVHLALHGHKHRAFLWRSSVFELPEDKKSGYRGDLSILGGGSAGSTERPNNRNYFSVLTMNTGRLDVDIYQAEGLKGDGPMGAFDQIGKWSARLNTDDAGRLTLARWNEVLDEKVTR